MRNYAEELKSRIEFIQCVLMQSGAEGIVYGNSGGKDSALVGALCKAACKNTVGIIMPCESKRNYSIDREDALTVASHFGIETREADISPIKSALCSVLSSCTELSYTGSANVNPRLRMTVLYALAASENRLVAGTGNRSEGYVGYFTKWGDGACDFNPISDLTVTEVYEFLRYLGCPDCVITKAPSAALFEGQTDEQELGFTYAQLDHFLKGGPAEPEVIERIKYLHSSTAHKRAPIYTYSRKHYYKREERLGTKDML